MKNFKIKKHEEFFTRGKFGGINIMFHRKKLGLTVRGNSSSCTTYCFYLEPSLNSLGKQVFQNLSKGKSFGDIS